MIRIIIFLITGRWHSHKWKIIKDNPCTDSDEGRRWHRYYCQCEHCGEIKTFDP